MLPRLCSPQTRALASKQCTITLANQGHRKTKTQCFSTSKQHFSPAAALANEPPKRSAQATVSPRLATRNVLKSVIKLVPRTVSGSSQKVWRERAQSAFDDLESGQNRPMRIAVWGDEISGAAELVTSLLDDPLSNDSEQRNRIHQRWMSDVPHDNTIWIRTNDRPPLKHQTLDIKSSWLHGLNAEIVECRGVDAFATLLSSDHIIFVTDNIRLLSAPGLQHLLQKLSHAPSIHLIVNERAPGVPVPRNDLGGIVPTVIKPEYAIRGLRAFARGDISQYQELLMESGVPQLAQRISHQCSESGVPSSASSTVSLAVIRTATHTARATLAACETAIFDAQNTLSTTTAPLGLFKTEVDSIYPAAYQSVLRGTTTVREGEAIVEKRLRTAFGRLPWYSLWWRADEVSGTLGEAISWGSLGTQLAFHAGRLSNIREQLYLKAADLAFPSPILKNRLAQINTRTSVGPDALSSPLIKRTAQLLAPGGPVEDVHRKAQGAVMTTAANILGSGAVGTGLFIAGSVGAGTAVGLGLLGSVASIRWMQSAWARAEKRWWADWARVCTGLERDCEVALKEVVRERVTGSAVAGIEGMETIAARRAEIISALKSETTDLKQELVALEQRLK